MLNFFVQEPVTIHRKSFHEEDDFGNPRVTETTVETTAGVAFGNTKMIQNTIDQGYQTSLTLFFEAGTIILEDDVFTVRGTKWVKNGSIDTFETRAVHSSFLMPPTAINVIQYLGASE